MPLAGHAQARPVAYPGGNLDLDALPHRPAAGVRHVDDELPGAPLKGFLQADLDFLFQVLPRPRARPAGPPGTAGAPTEEGLEEVPQVASGRLEVHRGRPVRRPAPGRRPDTLSLAEHLPARRDALRAALPARAELVVA